MNFEFFNIADALSVCPDSHKTYDPDNPPYKMTCLSKESKSLFEKRARLYRALCEGESEKSDSSDTVIAIDVDDAHFSPWHLSVASILGLEKSWTSFSELSGNNSEIVKLKGQNFEHVSLVIHRSKILATRYKHLKHFDLFHRACFAELERVRSMVRFSGWGIVPKIEIKAFSFRFCHQFGDKLKTYLDILEAKIKKEKSRLAHAMLARLRVADETDDLMNGDLLYSLAKKIEGFCKKEFFFKPSSTQVDPSLLPVSLSPQAPQRELDPKTFKSFCRLVCSVPETFAEFLTLEWFSKDHGLHFEVLLHNNKPLLVPRNNQEISINLRHLKKPLKVNVARLVEFNRGMNQLVSLFNTFFSLNYKKIQRRSVNSLCKNKEDVFKDFISKQIEIQKLAVAINLSTQAMFALCKHIKEYELYLQNHGNPVAEKTLYNAWHKECSEVLLTFIKYIDVLNLFFMEWTKSLVSVSLGKAFFAPVLESIKAFDHELKQLGLKLDGKEIKCNFHEIFDQKVDDRFFKMFLANLDQPKQEFISTSAQNPYSRMRNTSEAQNLVEFMVALSPQPALVSLVGNIWRGVEYPPNLLHVRFALALPSFQKHQGNHLHGLMLTVREAVSDQSSPGFKLLTEYSIEEKAKDRSKPTLSEEWESSKKERITKSVTVVEGLIRNFEDNLSPELKNCLDGLPEFDQLSTQLQTTLKESVETFLERDAGFGWDFLYVLKKIKDESLIRKYLEKKLAVLITGNFSQPGIDEELRQFNEVLLLFPKIKQEVQEKVFKDLSKKIDSLKGFSSIVLILKIAEKFLEEKKKEAIRERLDALFFSALEREIELSRGNPDISAWQVSFSQLRAKHPSFPASVHYKKRLAELIEKDEDWSFEHASLAHAFKMDARGAYFQKGLRLAIKEKGMRLVDYRDFYRLAAYNTNLIDFYGPCHSEVFPLLESAIPEISDETILGMLELHLMPLFLLPDINPKHKSVLKRFQRLKQFRSIFLNPVEQIQLGNEIKEENLRSFFTEFDRRDKEINKNLLIFLFENCQSALIAMGTELTQEVQNRHQKIQNSFKNVQILLRFFESALKQDLIDAKTHGDMFTFLEGWNTCLPGLKKTTFS